MNVLGYGVVVCLSAKPHGEKCSFCFIAPFSETQMTFTSCLPLLVLSATFCLPILCPPPVIHRAVVT